ncbi:sulfatase-like hydrolase/transferase [Chitinophaga pinensis]|uniref:sulfatase-like hydrolase/transferase n=1 Tax=Chitinophaga pinensis TaxID=79329 RepID=UPI0021BD9ABD|nr:sulfatase-like hydrolase/transferase [Chitinophaga pinensis]
MEQRNKYRIILLLSALFTLVVSGVVAQSKPNIIILYADDLGYGDVGCYGAKAVRTPEIDRLAGKGLRFTDAHCTAATCTPSRLSLLTGTYAFRKKAAILPGDAPLLIPPATHTLPRMLQLAGYTTAVIGKWHLGLGNGVINWNEAITRGPNEIGLTIHLLFLPPLTGYPLSLWRMGRCPTLIPMILLQ